MIYFDTEKFRKEEKDIAVGRKGLRDIVLKGIISLEQYTNAIQNSPITFDTYQSSIEWSAARTPTDIARLDYMALGLGGETGEVVDEIKKMHRDDKNVLTDARRAKIAEEAGDLLYYLAGLLAAANLSLEEVANNAQIKSVRRFKEYLDANKI